LALPGSLIRLTDVGVNPTRTGFIELLQSLGAPIRWHNRRSWQGEPVADLVIGSAPLRPQRPLTIGGELIPRLIDELPILAVLATRIEGGATIRDAQELRVKESDRIRAVAANLRRMGARVREFPDGWHIPGPQPLRGAHVDAHGDHRIAMAFAIAGLMAEGETAIESSEVVDISFPGFFSALDALVER
ncbi:MAG: 3-phosphoshikimate 1-carboxyvinyltransferase, partial [Acidobacteria bacterium]